MNRLEIIRAKAAQDAAFAAAMKAAKTQEELLAVLRGAGFDLTISDLRAMRGESGTAISDEELDGVAGGIDFLK